MRTSRLILVTSCVLIAVLLLASFGTSREGLGSLDVVVTGQSTNEAGARFAVLQITNRGAYRICLPDSCSVQSIGSPRRVYIPTTNLWLNPSDVVSIQAPAPDLPGSGFRVAVGYYSESPWNRFKMRLSSSLLGPKLPSALVRVKGTEVWSPWMAD